MLEKLEQAAMLVRQDSFDPVPTPKLLSVVTAWQDSSKERLVKLHVFLVFQVLTTMPLVRLVARAVVRTNTLTTHCKLHAKTAALASTHQQEHPRATNVPRVSTEERTTLLV